MLLCKQFVPDSATALCNVCWVQVLVAISQCENPSDFSMAPVLFPELQNLYWSMCFKHARQIMLLGEGQPLRPQ